MAGDIFLYALPGFNALAEDFFSDYDCQNILTFPKDQLPPVKPKDIRVCRFCGLDSSKTTFKNRPHIAPIFLGNKYGISDFECDVCNQHFCLYESHLAFYIGLNQTFSGSLSRKGIPTLKSSKKDLEVRAMNLYGVDGIMIQKTSRESSAIDWSIDDTISITFSKGSYKPEYVYKILLKIALCSLPEEEVLYYKAAFDYLRKNLRIPSGMANLGIYDFKIDISHSIPFGYLFKKKQNVGIPTHQFAFYFQNRIITFCLPYNSEDFRLGLYDGKKREVHAAPPLSTIPITKTIPCIYSNADFSSNESVRGEEQTIVFKVNQEHIKNSLRIDPKTGEKAISEPSEEQGPKGIFLVPKNTVIPLEAFKQYPGPRMCYD